MDREPRPSSKIFISNLNMDTTEDDLRKGFRDFGMIVDITMKHKDTGITYAFVEYDSQTSAQQAVSGMHQKTFMGKELKVQIARGKSDRGGGFRSKGNYDSRPYNQKSFGDKPTICYNCQEEGHFARDCKNPRKQRKRFDDRERGGGGFRGRDGGRDDYRRRDNYRDRDQRDKRDFKRKRSRSLDKHRSRSRSRSRSYEKRRKYKARSPSNSSHS